MNWEKSRNWENVCLISLHADRAGVKSAELWRKRYKIAGDSCFRSGNSPERYVPLTQDCLRNRVTLNTQLIIDTHASPDVVDGMSHDQLAQELQYWGLEQVGLISVRGCAVGANDYLERLRDDLDMRQIRVGWLIGYRGELAVGRRFTFFLIPFGRATASVGLPADKVGLLVSEISGGLWASLRALVFPLNFVKLPEALRVKTVEGNAATDTRMNRQDVIRGRVSRKVTATPLARKAPQASDEQKPRKARRFRR